MWHALFVSPSEETVGCAHMSYIFFTCSRKVEMILYRTSFLVCDGIQLGNMEIRG